MKNNKTLYLWDLAGTIFREEWDAERTGFAGYYDWLEARLGKKMSEITPREEEEMYKVPYGEGWYFKLDLMPGAKESLEWAEYSEVFTQGNPEQIDWRAEYLTPRIGFDVRKFFKKINSTFDYAETNVKTKEMLLDYLRKKYDEGFKSVVYTDDKLKNCENFAEAAEEFKKESGDFSYRLYHIMNDGEGLRAKEGYVEIGSLHDLIEAEKNLQS